MIVDQSRDTSGQNIYRLSKLYSPPDFVKSAGAGDLFDDSKLQPHQFGHPVKRLFPCHTKSATWMSMAFFLDQKEAMPPKEAEFVEARLKDFADYFNISQHVAQMTKSSSDFKSTSKAIDPKDYALGNRYPLRNASEVKTAAQYLHKYRDQMRFTDRKPMAENILRKAAELEVDLSDLQDFLEKQAGTGLCVPMDAAKLMWERITVLDNQKDKNLDLLVQMTKAAMSILEKEAELYDKDNLCNLATFLDRIDEGYGLKQYYGQLISRPEDVLFGVTKRAAAKVASEVCQLTSGSVYKHADFESLKLDDLRGVMGEEFADSVSNDGVFVDSTKMAEVLPTMPRPDAELFDRLCNKNGVRPCLKQASAAEAYGPAETDLKAWAASYKQRATQKRK